MNRCFDRREFFRSTAALATGAAVCWRAGAVSAAESEGRTSNSAKLGWQLSGQLYTYRRFSFYEALPMIDALGMKHVEPCFFLALDKERPKLRTNDDLSPELRAEMKAKLAARGMSMTTYYANLTTDADAARKVFAFAKEMGVRSIVSEPPAEAFDMLEALCNEFEINLAIHNHPKRDNYALWEPAAVLQLVDKRGKRIGACADTGHWVRSGLKPVECLKQLEGRIVSMHLKDVGEWNNPKARDVPLGTGLADYGAVLKELHRQRYQGVMGIEYEHDSPQLQEDVAACVAFVEQTAGQLG